MSEDAISCPYCQRDCPCEKDLLLHLQIAHLARQGAFTVCFCGVACSVYTKRMHNFRTFQEHVEASGGFWNHWLDHKLSS